MRRLETPGKPTGARAVALLGLLAATTAHADVWQRATAPASKAGEIYEMEMRSGDDLLRQASAESLSRRQTTSLVDLAVSRYRNAAAARPDAAEPHFREASAVYIFYFEICNRDPGALPYRSRLCDADRYDARRGQQVIDAWDAFEARAPLDPRLCGRAYLGGSSIYFERAILHTRFGTKEELTLAARDYGSLVSCAENARDDDLDTVWSNLAETYMMLDRLEDAEAAYAESIRRGSGTGSYYGLAVALDRDGESDRARDLIRGQGAAGFQDFEQAVHSKQYFYVPAGEEYYYLALGEEAFGDYAAAADHWRAYIDSGAHPEFQPRAKAHLAALKTLKRVRVPLPAPVEAP